MTDIEVIAHRGSSLSAPENTTAAIELALAQRADAVEIDIQQTADGELVLWHDDTLDRIARRDGSILSGTIREATFDELALCDIGTWFNQTNSKDACESYVGLCPLRLEDVLRRYGGRVPFFIELKSPERSEMMVERVLELLDRYPRTGTPHRILTADAHSLIKIRCMSDSAPLVQLLPHSGQWPLTIAEIARYAQAIGPLRSMVGRNLVATAKRWGLEVFPYTVNDPAEMRRLSSWGANGLITDSPEILRALVDERIRSLATSSG